MVIPADQTTYGRSAWTGVAWAALGIIVFAAASWLGHPAHRSHESVMLRRMVQALGLGLVVFAAAGGHIHRWGNHALERLDRWIRQDQRRAGLMLSSLMILYTIMYCGLTFARHYYFHSEAYDLGIQDQVIWNTAQGRPFARSLEVANDLGDHVRPYLALLSLVYLVIPSAYVLLAFQSTALAVSAWPLYRLGGRTFSSPAVGLVVALCGLAYPPLGWLNRIDFHSEVIAVPLLLAAYERVDGDDFKSAALCMGLALLSKENIGLSVAALGLIIACSHKARRFGLTWTVIGVAYSLVALFVIIPVFRGAPSDTLARYQWLGETPAEMLRTIVWHSGVVLQRVLAPMHLLTTLQLLAPFALLPLLSPLALFPAVPALVYNYLSEEYRQATIYHQYMAPVIPFMGIAAVLGLRRLTGSVWGGKLFASILPRRERPHQTIGLGLGILLFATVSSWVYENPITTPTPLRLPSVGLVGGATRTRTIPPILPNDAAIREGLAHVPDGVYLVTTNYYAPHLSHRPVIRLLGRGPEPTLGSGAQAVFLNLKDLRGRDTCERYRLYLESAARFGFGITFYRDGVVLAQKGTGDVQRLKELLDNWAGCE